ncbi:unnamed protein product, partial [Tetraodon nigroviridis]
SLWRDVAMLCTRRTKTLVSTCVILSGMTNIVCLLYVGWITNYVANRGPKCGGERRRPAAERRTESWRRRAKGSPGGLWRGWTGWRASSTSTSKVSLRSATRLC